MLFSIFVASLYSFLLEGFFGRTLGKEVMGFTFAVQMARHAA